MKKIIIMLAFFAVFFVDCAFAADINQTETASNAITAAERIVAEISAAGMGTSFFDDKLIDAKDAFKQEKYDYVLAVVGEISDRRERAFKINDSIMLLEIRTAELKKKGVDTSKPIELLSLAKSVFKKEAFDDAESLLSRTERELDETEADFSTVAVLMSSAKDNLLFFVKENWLVIIVSAFVFALCGVVLYLRFDIFRINQWYEDTKLQKRILEDLLKKTDSDYFEARSIGKEEYDLLIKNYQDELIEVKGLIPVFEDKLKRRKAFFTSSNYSLKRDGNKFRKKERLKHIASKVCS